MGSLGSDLGVGHTRGEHGTSWSDRCIQSTSKGPSLSPLPFLRGTEKFASSLSPPEPAALAGAGGWLVRKVSDSLQLLQRGDLARGNKQERGSSIKAERLQGQLWEMQYSPLQVCRWLWAEPSRQQPTLDLKASSS